MGGTHDNGGRRSGRERRRRHRCTGFSDRRTGEDRRSGLDRRITKDRRDPEGIRRILGEDRRRALKHQPNCYKDLLLLIMNR